MVMVTIRRWVWGSSRIIILARASSASITCTASEYQQFETTYENGMGPISNALSLSARRVTTVEFAGSLCRVLGIKKDSKHGQLQVSTIGES